MNVPNFIKKGYSYDFHLSNTTYSLWRPTLLIVENIFIVEANAAHCGGKRISIILSLFFVVVLVVDFLM